MSGSLLVRGGRVVIDDAVLDADVLVQDGVITGVGRGLVAPGIPVEDATGLLVLPGAIDPHVHFGWPGAADDLGRGSVAALCGGVTSVIEFAVQFPGEGLADVVDRWKEMGRDSACDFGLHAIVSDSRAETLDAMQHLADAGVTSFKMFMTSQHSGGLGVDDGTLFEIMRGVARAGGMSMCHCENDPLITHFAEELVAAGHVGASGHSAARPPLVEAEAIARAVRLADAAGSPFYIPHLSSAAGLSAAVRSGAHVPVIAETCPQFLTLTDEVYSRDDGADFVMSPPIKSSADRDELWAGLVDGRLATVGSDHCPYPHDAKMRFAHEDFRRIPNGVPGVETLLPVLITGGLRTGRLSITDVARIVSTHPANVFGLGARKGRIAPGMDGDLVLLDPDAPFDTRPEALHSGIDYSIYAEQELFGLPVTTVLGGVPVARRQQYLGVAPTGRFLERERPAGLEAFQAQRS